MTYDAVIVGFGPVGATLANLLARNGLRVAAVEAEREIYDKPRAISLDHEVMRIFQACGLAQRIAEFTAPHPGTHYLGVDGRVIKIFDPAPPPYPLGWSPASTFLQPALEAVLRDGTAQAGVDIFLGQQAIGLTQDAEGAAITVREAGGATRVLAGRYVLGCDGANSFVRKQLDIKIEDLAFDEWWMVVDARTVAPIDLPPKCIQYCWPSRPSTFVRGPGNLVRWEIKLLPGETPEEFGQPENVLAQVGRFADTSCLEIWRAAVYRFHALLAEEWRRDRVFLVGDACHQTPPFLGQGMCAGIRDAANLAWKLTMVVRGVAPAALLDSYARERKPHVRSLVATAKDFGLIIGELDPQAAQARDDLLHGQLERGESETIRQRYIPDLITGIIDRAPAARAAGRLFVQPTIKQPAAPDILLDDVLPPHFLLVTTTADAQTWLSPQVAAHWRRIGGVRLVIGQPGDAPVMLGADVRHVTETDRLFAAWAWEQGAAAVVRPDRYVFGAARDAGELNRLVTDLYADLFGHEKN